MNKILSELKAVKAASHQLMTLDDDIRRQVLTTLAETIRKNTSLILNENKKDLATMSKDDPKYDRLLLSEQRIHNITSDVEHVAALQNPIGRIIDEKLLPNALKLQKKSVPIGVVAVIYESRPNVTIDVFTLCFKTGNATILKGGKEAQFTNRCFVALINDVLLQHHVNPHAIYLLPTEREAMMTLLGASGLIDVCIPRGSQSLINFVREHAKIPVIETGAGIVHTYFDVSGDIEKGRLIINNAKTRRVSVCNALDTLIIHQHCLSDLYKLVELLAEKEVELFADKLSYNALHSQYPKKLLHKAKACDYGHEFLSYKMAIKTVASIEEAVGHITQYSSGHSEAILSNDITSIQYFLTHVDAAAVYVNASTGFTDGGQFGMGAEIGISTQKIHARGPMALEALTSYKWVIWGDGQIRK